MSFSVCLLPVMKVSVEILLWTFYIMMALDFWSVNVTVLIYAELMIKLKLCFKNIVCFIPEGTNGLECFC